MNVVMCLSKSFIKYNFTKTYYKKEYKSFMRYFKTSIKYEEARIKYESSKRN